MVNFEFLILFFSIAKIHQCHNTHFILRVNRFNLRVKCFNLGVINFSLRVKFYFACIWLMYSLGETSFKRLKT